MKDDGQTGPVGHNGHPWLTLLECRLHRGLSQTELAQGIVSQSLMSQIEHGRAIPQDSALYAFANRLQIDADSLLKEWHDWKSHQAYQRKLWEGSRLGDAPMLDSLLCSAIVHLSHFEFWVYQSMVHALNRRWNLADDGLVCAWFGPHWQKGVRVAPHSEAVHPKVTYSDGLCSEAVLDGPAMVVEALVHMLVYCGLGNAESAAFWEHAARGRASKSGIRLSAQSMERLARGILQVKDVGTTEGVR